MKRLGNAASFYLVLTVALMALIGIAVTAQQTTQPSAKQPIVFKAPKGYMPGEFSKHTGRLFLDPNKPAGMFVGYPAEGQDMPGFMVEMQKMVAGMFLHEAKDVVWNSATLPPHKGIESESGTLMTTSNPEMEVQLAFYVRADKGVAYGYYAMRHKKPKGDDAKFLDASGGGVKALDELAKSISG